MPRHAKLTKRTRNRAVIAGIRSHSEAIDEEGVGPKKLKSTQLIALFEQHLELLDHIDDLHNQKSDAILREAKLELAVRDLTELLKFFVRGRFGMEAPEQRHFGFRPRKKAKLTVVTKAVAVARRRETRRLRRTMGKRQRKKIKA